MVLLIASQIEQYRLKLHQIRELLYPLYPKKHVICISFAYNHHIHTRLCKASRGFDMQATEGRGFIGWSYHSHL